MTDFTTHNLETASDEGRQVLETVQKNYGFIPNLLGTMAEAPALAQAYLDIGATFSKTSLDATEQQVVLLAISHENACEYCVSAHSAIAAMGKVPADVIEAIREDKPLRDEKLQALREFAVTVVEQRGWADGAAIDRFLAAGYNRQQILEVVLGVGMKTLSNYTNHIATTTLDDAFAATEWKAPQNRVA